MNNILINACGIKSLGGIHVLKSSIENISQYSNVSVLVSEQQLKHKIPLGNIDNIVVKKRPRYTHPFLPLFIDKKLRDWINSFDITIHFGNFGFKTKTKDIVFVQNILPYSGTRRTVKNLILRFFINRSIAFSSTTAVQNEHVINYLPKKFHSKIKNIGLVSKSKTKTSNGRGIISISNDIDYKNVNFIEKVMNTLSDILDKNYIFTLVTDKKKVNKNSRITFKSDLSSQEVQKELEKHNIYLHASFVETLCLPIFEAPKKGLSIVAPNLDYAVNASPQKKYLYKYKNSDDAIKMVEEAIKDIEALNDLEVNLYTEDWNDILK